MLAGKVNSEKMYNLRILRVNIEIDVFVYYILLGVGIRKFTITYINEPALSNTNRTRI